MAIITDCVKNLADFNSPLEGWRAKRDGVELLLPRKIHPVWLRQPPLKRGINGKSPYKFLCNLILSIIIAIFVSVAFAASGGEPGEIFSMASDARSFGMARAFLAVSDDSSSSYWNPASMTYLDEQDVTLLHSIFWSGTTYDSIGYVYPSISRRAYGINVVRMDSPGFIKRDSDNNNIGEFGVSETAIGLSYGQLIGQKISMGSKLKYLQRSLDTVSNSLSGVDMYLNYLFFSKTRFALGIDNILATSSNTDDKLSMNVRAGFSQRFYNDRLIASVDIEQNSRWYGGVEAAIKLLALRFGINYEEITAGIGFKYNSYRFDYAMTTHSLGISHRASINISLGDSITKKRVKKAGEYYDKADSLVLEGKFEKALYYYEKGILINTDAQRGLEFNKLKYLIDEADLKDISQNGALEKDKRIMELTSESVKSYVSGSTANCARKVQSGLELEPDNNFMKLFRDILKKEGNYDVQDDMSGDAYVAIKLQKALNYFQEGQYELSLKECEAVLDIDPNNALARTRLGSAYYAIGLKDKAKEEWQKAIQIDPSNKELQEFIENVK